MLLHPITSTSPRFGAMIFRANIGGPNRDIPYFVGGFTKDNYLGQPLQRLGQIMVVERITGGINGQNALKFLTDTHHDSTDVAEFTELLSSTHAFDHGVDNQDAKDEINTPELQSLLRTSLEKTLPGMLKTLAASWRAYLIKNPGEAAWYKLGTTPQKADDGLLLSRGFFRDNSMNIPLDRLIKMMLNATGISDTGDTIPNPPKRPGEKETQRRLQVWQHTSH